QASLEHVTLGSRVTLTDLGNSERLAYSLLGPWDGGPEDGVLSYMSPLGRAVLDKKPGEEFEVTLPTGQAKYRVESIDRHRTGTSARDNEPTGSPSPSREGAEASR
ncbi:MAG: GreA/GreB family elongation factor, partial [Planctomycetes bacterium]|nr:GreA/GreB family elongation factor [Planctomycetota bacterium]